MSEEFNEKQTDEIEELEEFEEDVKQAEPSAEKKPSKSGKKPEPSKAAAAVRKVRKKNRIIRWFREMRSELKKVVWPTPKQIVNNTTVALVVMVASGIVIWAVDQVGSQIFRMLITLGS